MNVLRVSLSFADSPLIANFSLLEAKLKRYLTSHYTGNKSKALSLACLGGSGPLQIYFYSESPA